MENICKTCIKIWTKGCPIRVWGRTEGQEGKHLDVDPQKDYCSRYHPKSSYTTSFEFTKYKPGIFLKAGY